VSIESRAVVSLINFWVHTRYARYLSLKVPILFAIMHLTVRTSWPTLWIKEIGRHDNVT
jgi:hypothetical protein